MFDLVTPSLDVLNKENVASVTPFDRYRLWAQTALDSKPYPPAQARVEKLLRMYPILSSDELLAKRANALRHKFSLVGKPARVVRKTEQCSVLGRDISLAIWEPREAFTTIVWNLSCDAQLYEEALGWVAQHLCERLGAKLVAVSLAQCVHISASTTWSAFCADVAAVIDALPLPGKFVLVDDNVPTSCGWLLQHRLSGLIMINCHAVFEEEYLRSDSFRAWSTFMVSLAQSQRERDTTFLTSSELRNRCLDVTPKVLRFFEETLAARDAADWDLAAFIALSASNADITHEVMNRKPRDPPVAATVVVPAMGAKVAIQNSGMILRELLSNCELEFVLHSKKWWYLEGRNAWVDIVLAVGRLLARVNGREAS